MSKRDRWTSLTLTKAQKEFLDHLSNRARFTGGAKLARATIIRALVRAMRGMSLAVEGIRSEAELVERIARQLRKEG